MEIYLRLIGVRSTDGIIMIVIISSTVEVLKFLRLVAEGSNPHSVRTDNQFRVSIYPLFNELKKEVRHWFVC